MYWEEAIYRQVISSTWPQSDQEEKDGLTSAMRRMRAKNNVVALCDVDTSQAQRATEKFPKAKFYKDFRIMLEEMRDTIDAVTVSTPDHVHGIAAMSAMQLGKHVYVPEAP